MLALWLGLLSTVQAVETIPKDTLIDHMTSLRESLEIDQLPVGLAGFDVEDRLGDLVAQADFVVARRVGGTGDPDKLMKGLMKKTGSPCGLLLGGGGQNVTIRTAGQCEVEVEVVESIAATCRQKGLAKAYTLEPTTRVELLRPSLPDGLTKEMWEAATADLPAAVVACALVADVELPDTASLTLSGGWLADGTPVDATVTVNPDQPLSACAIQVMSCLPPVEPSDADRSITQVIRIVPSQAAPEAEAETEEPAEQGDAE